MYLIEIDDSGMAKSTGLHDGFMVIREFRELVQHKDYGIGAFTSVALCVDWMSPIRHYSVDDRPYKAMYNVTGDRRAFVWDNDLIQKAMKKYMELQPNPDLLEKRKLDKMLLGKLDEIDQEKDDDKLQDLFKNLNTIKGLLKSWNDENKEKNLFAEAPVVNGYVLSRLEEKALDPRSFYNN